MRTEVSNQFHMQANTTVQFISKIGRGAGLWKGWSAPVPGTAYDVELDILPRFKTGTNCRVVAGKVPYIRTEGTKLWITGNLESIDSDSIGYLRLADDCLV